MPLVGLELRNCKPGLMFSEDELAFPDNKAGLSRAGRPPGGRQA